MRRFHFGLSFATFRKRLKEMGLPSSRNAILNWERRGWIRFNKKASGWRYFENVEDMDEAIRVATRIRSQELPAIRKEQVRGIRGKKKDDVEEFFGIRQDI